MKILFVFKSNQQPCRKALNEIKILTYFDLKSRFLIKGAGLRQNEDFACF